MVDSSNSEQPLSLCIQNGEVLPGIDAGLQHYFALSGLYSSEKESVLANGISIGPRNTQKPAARATIRNLLLVTAGGGPLQGCLSDASALLGNSSNAANTLPTITTLQLASITGGQEIEVDQGVKILAQASDNDGDLLQLSITIYGVPPADCESTSCGDATFFSPVDLSSMGKAEVSTIVKFPLPGKYIIRAKVSDGSGEVITRDLPVIVYKKGDSRKEAPCCRHTPYIVGHNLGRPIDRTGEKFRFFIFRVI